MSYSFQTYLPYYKRNLKVALPIVLSQLGGGIVQLVDLFMVSRLGTIPLAAVSFASATFIIGFVFSTGILIGMTPLVGKAYAGGEQSRLSGLLQNGMSLSIMLGVVTSLVMFSLSFLMPYMGQDPAVVEFARPYFIILSFSVFPVLIFTSVKQFLEGIGNTSIAMAITIISNLLNILFNYLLIYGKGGFPEMGVLGAGIATLIARCAMPLMYIIYLRFKVNWWQYFKGYSLRQIDWQVIIELLKIGFPIAAHILLEVSAFALSGIMVGWLGAAPLAGNQIAQNFSHLTFMIVLGIASATTVRVSHQLGAENFKGLKMAAIASIHLCLLANLITGSMLIGFSRIIATAFSADPEVIAIGSQLLIMAGIFQLSDGMQAVGAGILRGLQDVKIVMIYAFIAYICINLPLGYFLAFTCGMGAVGVWTAFIFGLSVAAILFRLRYLKHFKQMDV